MQPPSFHNQSNAISRYRKYLESCYNVNTIAYDDKLCIAPCDKFINLALINKKVPFSSEDDTFTQSTFHGGMDEIVASKTPLEMDDVVTRNSHFILVEGPPGIGKSTMCWEFCRKWDTLKSLKHYKIVLLLKLRERHIQTATKLNELFFHDDEDLCRSVVKEVLLHNGDGVLLILDGFDEMPASSVRDGNNLIMRLISGKCIPKATLLVTSRPSALHHKGKFPENYRHVEILGFTDNSKMKYAEVAFRSKPDMLTHFKSFIFSNPVINSLMYLPINSAIIVHVYKDIQRSRKLMPKTITELYTTLILVLIRRHMIDKGKWDEDSELPDSLEDLPGEIIVILKRVSELAYRGLFEKDVQLEFSSSDVGKNFEHLGLLCISKEMNIKGAKTSYSFLHLSTQEFLAAWYVSGQPDLIKQKSELYHNLASVPPHLNAFVRILTGMVGLNRLLTSVNEVENLLLHCLFEAQNPDDFHLLKLSRQYIAVSNSLDAYVFGYTLVHAAIQWKLHISPSAFDMLLSSLANYSQPGSAILGSISELTPTGELGCTTYSFPKVKDLPRCLLQSIVAFSFHKTDFCSNIDGLITGIPEMCNLSAIDLTIESHVCRDDYKLFRSLQRLQHLEKVSFLLKCKTTFLAVHELSKFLMANHTLKDVTMYFYNNTGQGKYVVENNNRTIIVSALSCSTVTEFATNIPFVTSRFPRNMSNVRIEIRSLHNWPCTVNSTTVISKFIFSLADLCKISSMKSLSLIMYLYMELSLAPQIYCNFLAILNNSLHCNPAMNSVCLSFCHFEPLRNCTVLSQALQRDCNILRSSIRRSKSICDLSTPRLLSKRRVGSSVVRSHSCPDLTELKSLRSLHPLLDKELFSHCDMKERMPQLYPYLTKRRAI